tara:strand:+ start:22686 stop:23165 length:480 start_codon:yes stop_codon:yes gene_type:complete
MASFSGIAPRLPMHRDSEAGIALTQTISENTRQNLKMLLLTSPGERIMHIDYGVGIRRMLFEPKSKVVRLLNSRIRSQVKTYMPYITITALEIHTEDEGNLSGFLKSITRGADSGLMSNTLGLAIKYRINRAATDDWILLATGTGASEVPYVAFASQPT